jgi:hypothetical protein
MWLDLAQPWWGLTTCCCVNRIEAGRVTEEFLGILSSPTYTTYLQVHTNKQKKTPWPLVRERTKVYNLHFIEERFGEILLFITNIVYLFTGTYTE